MAVGEPVAVGELLEGSLAIVINRIARFHKSVHIHITYVDVCLNVLFFVCMKVFVYMKLQLIRLAALFAGFKSLSSYGCNVSCRFLLFGCHFGLTVFLQSFNVLVFALLVDAHRNHLIFVYCGGSTFCKARVKHVPKPITEQVKPQYRHHDNESWRN